MGIKLKLTIINHKPIFFSWSSGDNSAKSLPSRGELTMAYPFVGAQQELVELETCEVHH